MSDTSVIADIHRIIDGKIATGVVVTVSWVTRCILETRPSLHGEDADFYRECTSRDVTRIVRSALGKYDSNDITPRDLLLPGFEHLCRAYAVSRGDEPVLVPVEQCSDAELAERAVQLDKMALGCRSHARELREYINARAEAEAA